MQPNGRYKDRASVAVVSWIVDMLHANRAEHATPEVARVKGFEDFLPAIGQSPVAKQKAATPKFQIAPMIAGQRVRGKRNSSTIQFAAPQRPGSHSAQAHALVHFRVHKQLVAPLVPPK